MKANILLLIFPVLLSSCSQFKSDEAKRKDVIIASMKYMEAGDTSNFLKLFAEKNLIKDSSVLLTHFTMAGKLIQKYGMPSADRIVFKPLDNGVGELGTRAIISLIPNQDPKNSPVGLAVEYVFLNDNPEAKNFIDFKLSSIDGQ